MHSPAFRIFRQPCTTSPRTLQYRIFASQSSEFSDSDDNSTPQLTFTYLSPERAEEMEREREAARQVSLQEYEELKSVLLRRTWRFGTLFAGYLLLTVSAEAAFLELIGAATSYGYFLLLISDTEKLQGDTIVPLQKAEEIEPAGLRNIAKLAAAYQQALTPRLLIPVGLVAACAAWNSAFPDMYIDVVNQGCLIGGFLSYKIALVLKVYDDLKPRALTEEERLQLSRPQLVEVEDASMDFMKSTKTIEAEAALRNEAGAAKSD